jgi:hypothetical protein
VIDHLILTIILLCFGLMFLMAAVHKLTTFGRFRAVLADYRVMPDSIVPVVAGALPGVEIAVGLSWLFAPDPYWVSIMTALLLTIYTSGIALNLLRGRVHISCGCGFGRSKTGDDVLSWGLVVRNLILIAAASAASLPVNQRVFGAIDYVTLVAAVVVVALLFTAGNQLIRNSADMKGWRRPVHHHD